MDYTIFNLLLVLLENSCVVAVFSYLLANSKSFHEVLDQKPSWKSILVLIIAFGLISIFGTISGIPVGGGALANIRDMGPLIGGLIGGPIIGIGAGLVSGIHRYYYGGFTALSCSISAVISGLLGGTIYLLNRKKFIGIAGTVGFAVIAAGIDLVMALFIAKPADLALSVVEEIALPMTVANALGALIFSYIIVNTLHEQKVTKERNDYRSELDRKQAELNIAKDIQTSFLPEKMPEIPGVDLAAFSLPANEVGGDFYDFIPLGDKRIGLVIADVSGKSVPAALFMALSREVVRTNARWTQDARTIVSRANNIIAEDSRSGMFVTLFFAILDMDQYSMTYVNAGHNPPIVLGQSGQISTLTSNGIALGALEDADYEEKALKLEPGMTIVFYTDGVTDAENTAGLRFGEDRLRTAMGQYRGLAAGEAAEKIKSDVLAFFEGASQFDDITVMVLKVN